MQATATFNSTGTKEVYALGVYNSADGMGWPMTIYELIPITITVKPAPPTAAIQAQDASGNTITTMTVGQTATIKATFVAAGTGDTLKETAIASPVSTSLTTASASPFTPLYYPSNPATANPVTYWTPTATGSYTFYAIAKSNSYSTLTSYAQTTVTVLPAPQTVSISAANADGSAISGGTPAAPAISIAVDTGDSVTFTASGSQTGSYTWTAPDGTQTTDSSPTYTYTPTNDVSHPITNTVSVFAPAGNDASGKAYAQSNTAVATVTIAPADPSIDITVTDGSGNVLCGSGGTTTIIAGQSVSVTGLYTSPHHAYLFASRNLDCLLNGAATTQFTNIDSGAHTNQTTTLPAAPWLNFTPTVAGTYVFAAKGSTTPEPITSPTPPITALTPVTVTITVNPAAAAPTAAITASVDGGSTVSGSSTASPLPTLTVPFGTAVDLSAAFTLATGDSLTQTALLNGTTSVATGTTSPPTYILPATTPVGTYTFYANAATTDYPTAANYAALNVTVTPASQTVTVSASPSSGVTTSTPVTFTASGGKSGSYTWSISPTTGATLTSGGGSSATAIYSFTSAGGYTVSVYANASSDGNYSQSNTATAQVTVSQPISYKTVHIAATLSPKPGYQGWFKQTSASQDIKVAH